jgi:hypothetical protein
MKSARGLAHSKSFALPRSVLEGKSFSAIAGEPKAEEDPGYGRAPEQCGSLYSAGLRDFDEVCFGDHGFDGEGSFGQ